MCSRLNGEGRNRTGDTTIFSRVLYQLSYLAEQRDDGSYGGRGLAPSPPSPYLSNATFALAAADQPAPVALKAIFTE